MLFFQIPYTVGSDASKSSKSPLFTTIFGTLGLSLQAIQNPLPRGSAFPSVQPEIILWFETKFHDTPSIMQKEEFRKACTTPLHKAIFLILDFLSSFSQITRLHPTSIIEFDPELFASIPQSLTQNYFSKIYGCGFIPVPSSSSLTSFIRSQLHSPQHLLCDEYLFCILLQTEIRNIVSTYGSLASFSLQEKTTSSASQTSSILPSFPLFPVNRIRDLASDIRLILANNELAKLDKFSAESSKIEFLNHGYCMAFQTQNREGLISFHIIFPKYDIGVLANIFSKMSIQDKKLRLFCTIDSQCNRLRRLSPSSNLLYIFSKSDKEKTMDHHLEKRLYFPTVDFCFNRKAQQSVVKVIDGILTIELDNEKYSLLTSSIQNRIPYTEFPFFLEKLDKFIPASVIIYFWDESTLFEFVKNKNSEVLYWYQKTLLPYFNIPPVLLEEYLLSDTTVKLNLKVTDMQLIPTTVPQEESQSEQPKQLLYYFVQHFTKGTLYKCKIECKKRDFFSFTTNFRYKLQTLITFFSNTEDIQIRYEMNIEEIMDVQPTTSDLLLHSVVMTNTQQETEKQKIIKEVIQEVEDYWQQFSNTKKTLIEHLQVEKNSKQLYLEGLVLIHEFVANTI